jgi:hypothetical protein
VYRGAAPTYEYTHGQRQPDPRVVTAAATPRVSCVGDEPAPHLRVGRWPSGGALLETLGDLNADVRDALASERARLSRHGYPNDLPLPALWWTPRAPDELVEAEPLA